MKLLDGLSTVTVGELRQLRDAPTNETSGEFGFQLHDSQIDTPAQTPGAMDLVERLSLMTTAKLVVVLDFGLAREPGQRPSAGAVLERLRQTPRAASGPSSGLTRSIPFVGRHAELAALDAALLELRTEGRAIVTLVSGASGQGKSSLLSRWWASPSVAGPRGPPRAAAPGDERARR